MNIIVSAAALRVGGALTIYNQFITHLPFHINNNKYYVFIDESMPAPQISNVEYIVINVKSSIRRIYFDWIGCVKLLKRKNIRADFVISLQNTAVSCLSKIPQLLYYHQSIPLYPEKWRFYKKNERTLFFYKNIYPLFVKLSLTPKTQVVVQTHFMKKMFNLYYKMTIQNIHVCFPDINKYNIDCIKAYNWHDNKIHFIYPALSAPYKKHVTIVRALDVVKKRRPDCLKKILVHFTINAESDLILHNLINKFGVNDCFDFMGCIEHTKLLEMYKGSRALLFPSIIETIGLPLLEAASLGLSIIASDKEYVHEVLEEYEGVSYIKYDDYEMWADKIIENVDNIYKHPYLPPKAGSDWDKFFNLVKI